MSTFIRRITGVKPIAMGIALGMIAVGVLALVAGNYDRQVVSDQLTPQAIYFPKAGDPALFDDLKQYAGQRVDDGEKAKAYAEKYIDRHLQEVADGKTYAEVSTEAMANPDDAKLAGQKQALFQGETLRGLLLSVWGWSVVGDVAIAAGVLLIVLGAILFLLPLIAWRLDVRDARAGRAGATQPAPKG